MDDELFLAGKKYVSSRKAAEMTGYAKDYIGQLCRGGKLEAKLIGRNWYITVDSLTKSRKRAENEVSQYTAPSVPKKTHPKTSHLLDDLNVEFFSDDKPLMPRVEKSKEDDIESVPIVRAQETQNRSGARPVRPPKVTILSEVHETVEEEEISSPENESLRLDISSQSVFLRLGIVIVSLVIGLAIVAFPAFEVKISYDKSGETSTEYSLGGLAALLDAAF